MNSKEIQTLLTQKQQRLDELTQQQAQAGRDLETAQDGFTNGSVVLEVVTAKQAEANALAGAVKKIGNEVESLTGQLSTTLAQEKRAATVAQLQAICEEANGTAQDFHQAYSAIFNELGRLASTLVNVSVAHRATRQRFRIAASSLAPGITSPHATGVAELREELKATGIDLSGIGLWLGDIELRGFDGNREIEKHPLAVPVQLAVEQAERDWKLANEKPGEWA